VRIGDNLYLYNKRRGYISKRVFTITGETKTQWKLVSEVGADYKCRKSDLRLLGEGKNLLPNRIPEYDVLVEKQNLVYEIKNRLENFSKKLSTINLKKLREVDEVIKDLTGSIR